MTHSIEVIGKISGKNFVVKLKDKGYRYKAKVYIARDKPLLKFFKFKLLETSYPKVREYDKDARATYLVAAIERKLFGKIEES